MTPEDRFEHIERTLVQIVDIQREQAGAQRQQAALMLEIAQKHADLTDRVDAVIAVVERFLARGNGPEPKPGG